MKMKAAVFNGIEDITIEEIDKPIAGPDDFILKIKAAAICGSDLRTYRYGHSAIKPPQILGHEFSGVVDSVGENVTGIKIGDRVAVHPGIPCGHCYYCERGEHNLCDNRLQIGKHYPGAFAEYTMIPGKALEVGTVVKLPDDCSYEIGTLGEPLVAVLNGQELLDIQFGDTVLILGSGPIGIFHAMLAKLRGADKVILANLNEKKLNMARNRGVADYYYCISDKKTKVIREFIDSLTEGRGADKVVVANTSIKSACQAVELAAKNGKVLLFAGFPKDTPQLGLDGNLIHYKQITILGSSGSTPRQYRMAEELLFRKKIDAESIITQRIPLEQINEGFQKMFNEDALKVIIKYD